MKELLAALDWEPFWKGVAIFIIVAETIALWVGDDKTASAFVWSFFNVNDGWSWERIVLVVFFAWLLGHFGWQLWRGNPFD